MGVLANYYGSSSPNEFRTLAQKKNLLEAGTCNKKEEPWTIYWYQMRGQFVRVETNDDHILRSQCRGGTYYEKKKKLNAFLISSYKRNKMEISKTKKEFFFNAPSAQNSASRTRKNYSTIPSTYF